LFTEVPVTEFVLYRISNCLHAPSYVSLQSALAYYQLIPEAVYTQQAVSTRKTIQYETPVGTFQYRSVAPSCYFGYTILQKNGFPVLMAEMEKAVLDYFYLGAHIKTIHDLEAMRLNMEALQRQLDWEKLFHYASAFASRTLQKRVTLLQKLMHHAGLNGN
jgi:predicted transcriptional regulator of viral defense system